MGGRRGARKGEARPRGLRWGRAEGDSCRQGAPLPRRALSLLRLPEAAPRAVRKAGRRSGGQTRLGEPFQLLVLLQFPHPAERRGKSQETSR